ncbi:hypothetical protein GF359_07980 [candidate division WOR-3 bacterium]|uniref:Peptidyl-prolyl cis-trans isomerase n=1 Tax=candidate division WOR-3 bacterium TaxID=2052148 RepID=A0A9D5KAF8_UNCW3|nr:hypothetical protein [candidate division WOR-3 bacterium]MBD3365139.1 hypothetical protein [candidate division WOR-3 bacterium]
MGSRLKFLVVFAVLSLILGCQRGTIKPPRGPSPTFNLTPQERMELALKVRNNPVDLSEKNFALVETNKGNFIFKLYSEDAPKTVSNFVRLARAGFYDGLTWHRYKGGFIIQGGDPLGTGAGSAGYRIDLEISGKSHTEGAVGMARGDDPNSASCQFYVVLEPYPNLDDYYCVFGQVTEGMDVVKRLSAGNKTQGTPPDTIMRITISD